jgi:hypothetical protein
MPCQVMWIDGVSVANGNESVIFADVDVDLALGLPW